MKTLLAKLRLPSWPLVARKTHEAQLAERQNEIDKLKRGSEAATRALTDARRDARETIGRQNAEISDLRGKLLRQKAAIKRLREELADARGKRRRLGHK